MDVERETMSTGGSGRSRGSDLGLGLDLGDDDSVGSVVVGGVLLNSGVFTTGIDGNLDGDGTTTDLLALESVDGLLLFILVTNIDETIPLAFSGLTPPPSDDASIVDPEARLGEESGEACVVDTEAKIGNKEDGLGGFANWVLTDGTGGAGSARGTGGIRSPGFALPGLGNTLCGFISCGSVWVRSSGLSSTRPGLTALKAGSG